MGVLGAPKWDDSQEDIRELFDKGLVPSKNDLAIRAWAAGDYGDISLEELVEGIKSSDWSTNWVPFESAPEIVGTPIFDLDYDYDLELQ